MFIRMFVGRMLGSCKFLLIRLRLGRTPASGFLHRGFPSQAPPHQQSLIVFQRAGVGFLLRDAQLRKYLNDCVGLDFQLPGQLVDANFTHTLRL
jgi:hypothetical protein